MIAKAKELYASGVGRSQPFRFFSNDCGRSQHENRSRLVRKADVAVSHGDCQLCGTIQPFADAAIVNAKNPRICSTPVA
ncbi:MAG: hypothetical protein ACSHXD_13680, partial [Marinosulfonomonas sp.]